jgi:hypothetical protein
MTTLWLEPKLETILSLVESLGMQLQEILGKSIDNEDAETFGYYDAAEHITGLAFVACQTYIATVCGEIGKDKGDSLLKGPMHSGGLRKAQIINHAANYWKHNNEWVLTEPDRRREAIEKAFGSVGFSVISDYPLSGILSELSDPRTASLAAGNAILREWKDAILGGA